jgi:hypothetical protein
LVRTSQPQSYDNPNGGVGFVLTLSLAACCNITQIFDVPWKGMPVRRRRVELDGQDSSSAPAVDASTGSRRSKPIYSIVKHYPPDWQVKLANQAAAAATVKIDQVSL